MLRQIGGSLEPFKRYIIFYGSDEKINRRTDKKVGCYFKGKLSNCKQCDCMVLFLI